MKYMLLIHPDPSAWPNDPAAFEQMMGEYGAFTQEILDSGELLSGDPLDGPETATVVRSRDGQVAITDGPYTETKEHLGGYYVVDVKDLDRAIELAAQIPDSRTGGVEIRPIRAM